MNGGPKIDFESKYSAFARVASRNDGTTLMCNSSREKDFGGMVRKDFVLECVCWVLITMLFIMFMVFLQVYTTESDFHSVCPPVPWKDVKDHFSTGDLLIVSYVNKSPITRFFTGSVWVHAALISDCSLPDHNSKLSSKDCHKENGSKSINPKASKPSSSDPENVIPLRDEDGHSSNESSGRGHTLNKDGVSLALEDSDKAVDDSHAGFVGPCVIENVAYRVLGLDSRFKKRSIEQWAELNKKHRVVWLKHRGPKIEATVIDEALATRPGMRLEPNPFRLLNTVTPRKNRLKFRNRMICTEFVSFILQTVGVLKADWDPCSFSADKYVFSFRGNILPFEKGHSYDPPVEVDLVKVPKNADPSLCASESTDEVHVAPMLEED